MSPTNDSNNPFKRLALLSTDLSAKLAEVVVAAQGLIRTSYAEMLSQLPTQAGDNFLQLGRISFKWQLFIEQGRSSSFLFGFFRKNKSDNALKAEISFKLSPQAELPVTSDPKELAYWWAPPAFMEMHPPENLVNFLKGEDNKYEPEEVLWILLGKQQKDLLAINFRQNRSNPKMYFFENKRIPTAQNIKDAKDAPIVWFEAMLYAFQPWIQGKTKTAFPIQLQQTDSQITTILQTLSKNFVQTPKTLSKTQKRPTSKDIAQDLYPIYSLSDYRAYVILRLNEAGKIQTRELPEDKMETMSDEDQGKLELLQLKVQLKGSWWKEKPRIEFKIFPPDFITEGNLFDAFLECLLKEITEGRDRDIPDKLRVKREDLEPALSAPIATAFIFRIGKRRHFDIQMFVLPIGKSDAGQILYLMFMARFEVDASANKVVYKNNSLKNLLDKKGDQIVLENRAVKFVVRLLYQVNSWKNKVS